MRFNQQQVEGKIRNIKETSKCKMFTMSYSTYVYTDESGRKKYDYNELIVFLPNNSYGDSIYENIYVGRQVRVTGTLKPQNIESVKRGKKQCLVMTGKVKVEYLDVPVHEQVDYITKVLNHNDFIIDNKISCSIDEFEDCLLEYIGDRGALDREIRAERQTDEFS